MISATLSLVVLTSPMLSGPTLTTPSLDPLGVHEHVAQLEAASGTTAVKTEYWAGHQVVEGTREVPVLGTLHTRMDTYTLARVRRQGDTVTIDQRACKVDFTDVGGVKVYIDADVLPDSRLVFERVEDTPHYLMTGEVVWDEEDIDEDGKPGMRVYVDAPVCSGNLHVTNKTITNARAFGDKGPFYGEVTVTVRQKILDAEGTCLSGVAKDSYERSKGSFEYTKIKADATCQSLLDEGWPVKVK